MSSDELQELHHHAEHGREHPETAPISFTMAVLAVIVATVSLLGHRTHTQEIVLENKTVDEWAYYQAKNVRRHIDQVVVDAVAAGALANNDAVTKLQQKYGDEAKRYGDDQKSAEAEARNLENETTSASRRADRYDLAEVFLEIALVITSITLLTDKRGFWYAGIALGVIGSCVAVGMLSHWI